MPHFWGLVTACSSLSSARAGVSTSPRGAGAGPQVSKACSAPPALGPCLSPAGLGLFLHPWWVGLKGSSASHKGLFLNVNRFAMELRAWNHVPAPTSRSTVDVMTETQPGSGLCSAAAALCWPRREKQEGAAGDPQGVAPGKAP